MKFHQSNIREELVAIFGGTSEFISKEGALLFLDHGGPTTLTLRTTPEGLLFNLPVPGWPQPAAFYVLPVMTASGPKLLPLGDGLSPVPCPFLCTPADCGDIYAHPSDWKVTA